MTTAQHLLEVDFDMIDNNYKNNRDFVNAEVKKCDNKYYIHGMATKTTTE